MINFNGLSGLRVAGGQSLDLAYRGSVPLPPLGYLPPPPPPSFPLLPILVGAGLAYAASRYADLPTAPTVAAGALAGWVLA